MIPLYLWISVVAGSWTLRYVDDFPISVNAEIGLYAVNTVLDYML